MELEEFGDFAAALAEQEYRCVSTIAASPILIDAFYAAGGNLLLFDEPDARAIFVSINYCYETCEDKDRAQDVAKKLLTRMGAFANEHGMRFDPGTPWCDESLKTLFDGYPISATAVACQTRKLIAMKRREAIAKDHVRAARDAMWIEVRE